MSVGPTKLEVRHFSDINTWLPTGQGTDLPEVLQGIFFMDGNPLPEDCLTLNSNSTWDPETRVLQFPVYGPLQWTYEDSDAGRALEKQNADNEGVLTITFDEGLREGVIVASFKGVPIPAEYKWTMTQTEDSQNGETWLRKNYTDYGKTPQGGYTLRKVIRPDGEKLPAFNKMLEQVPETCIVAVSAEETC